MSSSRIPGLTTGSGSADCRFLAPLPLSASRDEFVRLSADQVQLARKQKGTLFRKHILTKGSLIHPVTKAIIKIDDDFYAALTDNFNKGYCDIVQIPLAGADNEHSEAPDRNIGEVVGLEEKDGKLYAVLDVRKHVEDIGNTLLGASAMFSLNYTDTRSGRKVGPTLLHTAVTNRPYVTGLEDYEQIVAATSDGTKENTVLLTAVSTKENHAMDLDTLLTTLLDEHGINVAELQAKATAGEAAIALSNSLGSALKDANMVKLSNGEEVPAETILASVVELADTNVALSARLETLENDKAAASVDALVSTGHIIPAHRDAMLELKLSNPEMFDKLVPETPLVKLSVESGFQPDEPKSADMDAEIERLSKLASTNGYART